MFVVIVNKSDTGFMCSWPYPYSTLILGVFPLHQISHMLGVNERMGLKLFGCEIIFEEFQPMWSRYLSVCVASRGKNGKEIY